MMNAPSSEPSVPPSLPSSLPPTPPSDNAPQQRASLKPMWIAITAGSIALTAGIIGGIFAYMTHLEHERQAEENARVIAAMEARHREEMESRKQQLRERLAAKEEEVRREAEKAEERARAWKREQEEAKRKAEEERQKREEKERQAKERSAEAEQLCTRAAEAAQAGNDAEAVECYKQACDAGSADAAYRLGQCYSQGKGIASNLYRAAELYRLAAERGSAEGAFAYGKCLIEGNGISANADEGLEWVNKAADNGMWEAKDFLAERKARANELAHAVFPDLQPLIDRMRDLRCKHSESAVQQSYLLKMLPQIRDGADVNMTTGDSGGHTALHYSCGIGSRDITAWLLNHGANANAKAYNGETPISCARSNGTIIALLVQHGAVAPTPPPVASPVSSSRYSGANDMLNIVSQARCRNSTDRVFQGKLQSVFIRIMNSGVGVNAPLAGETNTPLHYACGMNQAAVVEWLLNHGANPYARNKHGQTPADCARYNNSWSALNVLQSRGYN